MKQMFIKINGKLISINIYDILYISSNGEYCTIKCINNIQYTIKATMKSLEIRLNNYDFIRIHNCSIVNLKHINSIDDSSLAINSEYLSISRHKMNELKTKIVLL